MLPRFLSSSTSFFFTLTLTTTSTIKPTPSSRSHSQTTSLNIATCLLLQLFTARSCTSKTSHCFALKNVCGPIGGPRAGGTMSLLLPPGRIPSSPSSNPGISPPPAPTPNRAEAGLPFENEESRCSRKLLLARPLGGRRLRLR